jgi:hypothetical protein
VHFKNTAYGNGYPLKLLFIDQDDALEVLMNHEFVKSRPDR